MTKDYKKVHTYRIECGEMRWAKPRGTSVELCKSTQDFVAANRTEAAGKAREAGWLIPKENYLPDICPFHMHWNGTASHESDRWPLYPSYVRDHA